MQELPQNPNYNIYQHLNNTTLITHFDIIFQELFVKVRHRWSFDSGRSDGAAPLKQVDRGEGEEGGPCSAIPEQIKETTQTRAVGNGNKLLSAFIATPLRTSVRDERVINLVTPIKVYSSQEIKGTVFVRQQFNY